MYIFFFYENQKDNSVKEYKTVRQRQNIFQISFQYLCNFSVLITFPASSLVLLVSAWIKCKIGFDAEFI